MNANYNLKRFTDAQHNSYETALSEIRAGRKRTHWMWYIFPQLKGLGRSGMSEYYGLSGISEARAYLADPILGARLSEISYAVLCHKDKSAEEIFDGIDAVKLRSCMTLFKKAAPEVTVFGDVLAQFFDGQEDPATVQLLKNGEE